MNVLSLIRYRDKVSNQCVACASSSFLRRQKNTESRLSEVPIWEGKVEQLGANFKEVNGFRRVDVPRYHVSVDPFGLAGIASGLPQTASLTAARRRSSPSFATSDESGTATEFGREKSVHLKSAKYAWNRWTNLHEFPGSRRSPYCCGWWRAFVTSPFMLREMSRPIQSHNIKGLVTKALHHPQQ